MPQDHLVGTAKNYGSTGDGFFGRPWRELLKEENFQTRQLAFIGCFARDTDNATLVNWPLLACHAVEAEAEEASAPAPDRGCNNPKEKSPKKVKKMTGWGLSLMGQ